MKQPRTIDLTPKERKKLRTTLLGYGKLTEAAEKSGLHINTLSRVNSLGYGEPATIKIIRETLLAITNVKAVA